MVWVHAMVTRLPTVHDMSMPHGGGVLIETQQVGEKTLPIMSRLTKGACVAALSSVTEL
jgi:hypothetical protein